MTYYRVDKRQFSMGEEICTASEYYDKFKNERKVVEDCLELRRPTAKVKRTNCLFLFDNEECARKHWIKMTDGKLYEVSVDETSILHSGDMALMDRMKKAVEYGNDITSLADYYWIGTMSDAPIIEILVEKATIKRVVSSSEQERKAHLHQWLVFGNRDPDSS